MIYIISGHPRSGTSAMMQALEAGGLEAVKSEERAKQLHRADSDGYQVNPGDVYEATNKERACPGWPRQHDGKAVKCVVQWVPQLAIHKYRVVLIRRHPEEIRQSYKGAFNLKTSCKQIESIVKRAKALLGNRRDVHQLIEIRYDDLLADPAKELGRLEWPIDVEAAANIIDPGQKRFRLELLDVRAP